MNNNFPKMSQVNFSGTGCWLTVLLACIFLSSIGLGWLVNGVFILLGLLLLTPVIAWFGFQWWLKRNVIQGQCPVCSHEFTGLNKTTCQCPSCGESLKIEGGVFQRLAAPGTIDVEAVEVQVQSVED